MIEAQALAKVKSIVADLGFVIDAGLMTFKEGKVQIHRLTKIESGTGETLLLDLLLVTDATREAWASRTKVEWDRGELSVVSPEGLIALKRMRKSGQDEDDIERLRSIIDED